MFAVSELDLWFQVLHAFCSHRFSFVVPMLVSKT